MHEQQSEGVTPGSPVPAASEHAFSLHRKFPGQGATAETPAPSRSAGKRKSYSRVFIALGLFIAMVGGVAFVVQYTPNWRSKKNSGTRPGQPPQELVEFPQRASLWDAKDETYIKEFEQDVPGHYDYPFRNKSGEDAEMGLLQTNCDCTSIELYLMSDQQLAAWEKAKKGGNAPPLSDPIALKVDERKGIGIPSSSGGVVRVTWKSRKGPGELLRLNVRLWSQPKGKIRERSFVELETRCRIVTPVLFDLLELSVGTIPPGAVAEAQCLWWSSTRPKLTLKANSDDPLIIWTVTRFSPEERVELEKQLRQKNVNSRVLVAGRLSVKVVEEKGKQQLDQGPFARIAPLLLDDYPLAILPRVVGRVQGEVEVGSGKDQGKINLHSFAAASGKKQRVQLRSEHGTMLTVDSQKPSYLKARLRADKAGSTAQKASWILELEVPPGSHLGPFAEDSAIILRTQATPPRYIRIPVQGNAVPR